VSDEYPPEYVAGYVEHFLEVVFAYVALGQLDYRRYSHTKTVRTRKTHECVICKRRIPAGVKAVRLLMSTARYDHYTIYAHESCYRKAKVRFLAFVIKFLKERETV